MNTREIAQAVTVAVAIGLSAQVALADTVVLRDGRVLTGHVVERGDQIIITMPLGGMTIERSDVVRIEGAAGVTSVERPAAVEDVVVLRDGRTLRGDVRMSEDGSEVIVSMGERGEARHPRYSVAVIQRRDGTEEVAPSEEENSELRATINRRVAELSHEGTAIRADARRELLALGSFAKSYLARLCAESPQLIPIMEELELLEGYRKVLPVRAEETIPHLAERLVARGEEGVPQRESALKSIVLEAPDDAAAVLLHAVATDDSSRIKAYCITQLSSLRAFPELAQVLQLTDGPLRLAAAFALGDAGILVGVPILLEALKLSDPAARDIREATITKLREYTGQHFGYRSRATTEERAQAIEKWEAWWAENGAAKIRAGIKQVAPNLPGGRVTEEETHDATELWAQATRMIGNALEDTPTTQAERDARREKLRAALDVLRRALASDPGLSSARMTRAVLLYEEFARFDEAKHELGLLLVRAKHDPGEADVAKKFAHYHLGKIALAEGLWEKATVRFTQSLNYDQLYVEAHEGQGDAYFQIALTHAGTDPQDDRSRREALDSSRQAYRGAITALGQLEDRLHELMRELVTDAPGDLEEGRVLQSVQRSGRDMDRRKAAVYAKLGRVSSALHDDARALESYRLALELDPKNEEYQRAVELWTDQGDQ